MWLVACALSACGPTLADMQTVRDRLNSSYGGSKIDALILRFGAPAAVATLSDGSKHFTFIVAPMDEVTRDGRGGTVTSISCKVLAIVDARGSITQMGTTDFENQYGGSYCARVLGMTTVAQ